MGEPSRNTRVPTARNRWIASDISTQYRLIAEDEPAGHPPMHGVNVLPANSITTTCGRDWATLRISGSQSHRGSAEDKVSDVSAAAGLDERVKVRCGLVRQRIAEEGNIDGAAVCDRNGAHDSECPDADEHGQAKHDHPSSAVAPMP